MMRVRTLVIGVVCCAPLWAMAAEWTLADTEMGPLKIGMPLSAIPIAMKQPIERTIYNPKGSCFYVFPSSVDGVNLMMEGDVLSRIELVKPGIGTVAGLAVGDPVGKLVQLYGGAAIEGHDAYDETVPEFTVTSADGRYATRFGTHQGKVAYIVAGRARSVAYIEGCL